MGGRGTARDECTSTFGGTSAAAPLAAGVIALVLQANPNLTWRDVQAVIIDAAAKHREGDPSWQTNEAGYRYSHNFGFGLLDAFRSVQVAKEWMNLSEQYNWTATIEPNLAFTDNDYHNVTFNCSASFVVEHVNLYFSASCGRRGDLFIKLISPFGSYSILAEEHGDSSRDYPNWRFGSIVSWGESSSGIWTLTVKDTKAPSGGVTLTSITLEIFGHQEVSHGKRM